MIPIKHIDKNDILLVESWVGKNNPNFRIDNNIIYGRLDFINQIFNEIKKPTTIVTDSGDISLIKVDNKHICATDFREYADFTEIPNNVVKWFGTSLNVVNSKFEHLPLGILPEHRDAAIEIAETQQEQRDNLLYVNFGLTSSFRQILDLRINDKKEYKIELANFAKIEYPPENIGWPEYRNYLCRFLHRLLTSKYVLCPHGVGIDTFRFYEAMYLGCIPIVMSCPFYDRLKDWPILIVDSFEFINEELLYSKYEELNSKFINIDFLKKSYYLNKIQQYI